MQRARVPRAVELSPGLADSGGGVPHPAQVVDRLKDRHEHILQEVGDGRRRGVDFFPTFRFLSLRRRNLFSSLRTSRPPLSLSFRSRTAARVRERGARVWRVDPSAGDKEGDRESDSNLAFAKRKTKRCRRLDSIPSPSAVHAPPSLTPLASAQARRATDALCSLCKPWRVTESTATAAPEPRERMVSTLGHRMSPQLGRL